jgi:hypothetical protein
MAKQRLPGRLVMNIIWSEDMGWLTRLTDKKKSEEEAEVKSAHSFVEGLSEHVEYWGER